MTGTVTASRTYMLVMLVVISALNQLDRQLVNILIEPIRHEFKLTDVQIGLLSGLAFAIVYGAISVPASLFAVHHSRKRLLASSVAVWGGMTLLAGYSQSYAHLLAARLGVAIGEAGGMPPSHAMISDCYQPHERAAAMSTWAMGVNIGILLAFFCGGLVGQLYGWRVAFIGAGILTVAIAILVQLTVREPPLAAPKPGAFPSRTLLSHVLRLAVRDRVVAHVFIGATLASTVGYSFLTWLPSFLIRSHGLGIAEAGIYIALVAGLLGALGTLLGGRLTERLQRRDARWALWVTAAALLAIVPFGVLALFERSTALAISLLAVQMTFAAVFVGPSLAILHNRVARPARPVASAVLLLVVNSVGLACGPLGVGALSQYVFFSHGEDSLRFALITVELLAVLAAVHFFVGGSRLLERRGETFEDPWNAAR